MRSRTSGRAGVSSPVRPRTTGCCASARTGAAGEDPQLARYALAYARGDRDLAQDGLDDAFWSLERVQPPERIRNLRAVVYQSVRNAINRQRNQLGAALVEDFGAVAERHPG